MKLTENQRRILYAVTLNAGRSVAELARMLELRDHVIRRALDSFFEANIFLRRSTWVNTHLLGLDYHVIHIELPLASISARKSFLELLASSEEAAAVVELSSEAQFELRIVTRNSLHLSHFFESISERFNAAANALNQSDSFIVFPLQQNLGRRTLDTHWLGRN